MPSNWIKGLKEEAQLTLPREASAIENHQEEGVRQGRLLCVCLRGFSSGLFCFLKSKKKGDLSFTHFILRLLEELRESLVCKPVGTTGVGNAGGLPSCRPLKEEIPAGDFEHIFPLSASFSPSFNIILFLFAQKRSL